MYTEFYKEIYAHDHLFPQFCEALKLDPSSHNWLRAAFDAFSEDVLKRHFAEYKSFNGVAWENELNAISMTEDEDSPKMKELFKVVSGNDNLSECYESVMNVIRRKNLSLIDEYYKFKDVLEDIHRNSAV